MPRALDTAAPVTNFVKQIADYRDAQGRALEGVIRYYRPDLDTRWAISPNELRAIFSENLWFMPVFQGGKSTETPAYYRADQGGRDADAAIRKADQLAQPAETSIAFAVDTDIINKTIDDVCRYFEPIGPKLHARGLWVCAYGDDLVCRVLQERGLIDVAWLANAKGWRDDRAFEGWAIQQEAETGLPFGLRIDPNEVKDFKAAGFWRA